MSRKAPFGVVGISALAIFAVVATAAAGDKGKKRPVILPPADAAERLQAHPRVPVEVAPLSGTMPSSGTVADSSPEHVGLLSAGACAGSKVSRAECAQWAARIDRFMNERRAEAATRAPSASDVCRKPGEPASRCAAFVAQIGAWLKTRQTAEVAAPPAVTGSTTHDR
jgi:hypothetical protein